MKKLILIMAIIFIGISPVYPQTYNNIFQENTSSNLFGKTKDKYNLGSVNTSFSYLFVNNTSSSYTNSKGFTLDLQINQNQITSWLVGFNMNFYKRFTNIDTSNLYLINILVGPKFYFNDDNPTTYFRINTGMTFFNLHKSGNSEFAVILFPAIGIEYKFSKYFKLYIEPNINAYFTYDSFGYFGINAGISTIFY